MNTFKNLADTLAKLANTNLEGVERLVRWQEYAGLLRRGSFMQKATFSHGYSGEAVPERVTAALLEVTTLAMDHADTLLSEPDRVGWLLENITAAAPIASVRRWCGLSLSRLAQVMDVPQRAARALCGDEWWELDLPGRSDHHDRIFARLAPVLAGQFANARG